MEKALLVQFVEDGDDSARRLQIGGRWFPDVNTFDLDTDTSSYVMW